MIDIPDGNKYDSGGKNQTEEGQSLQIGAQFYTVREQCQNLDDFALTLKKVADIGYRTVQISGTCPYPAQPCGQDRRGYYPGGYKTAG